MPIDFRIADYCYPIDIFRLRSAFERNQWLSPPALLAHQSARLRALVAHAYAKVPYYRQLLDGAHVAPDDIRGVEDLPAIPPLTKSALTTQFGALTARPVSQYRPMLAQTSGSSGEPTAFYLDRSARVLEFVYYWRHWSWLGYRLGTPFAELSSVAFLARPDRADRLCHYEPLTRRLLLNSLRLGDATMPAIAEVFSRYQPRYLKGMASALGVLAALWHRRGGRFRLRGVFSSGDGLLETNRRLVEDVFQCQVLDSYGHMERTFAVSECPSGGYHVNSDYGILELVPVDGYSAPGGERTRRVCRALGTGLHNLAMPLIRYEVGDLIEVDDSRPPCPCGRGFPLIGKFAGRNNDIIRTPDGRFITSMFVVFDLVPHVQDGQIVQDRLDHVRVTVVRAPSYQRRDEVALLSHLGAALGTDVTITLEYADAIAGRAGPAGKARRVVSRLPSRVDTEDG